MWYFSKVPSSTQAFVHSVQGDSWCHYRLSPQAHGAPGFTGSFIIFYTIPTSGWHSASKHNLRELEEITEITWSKLFIFQIRNWESEGWSEFPRVTQLINSTAQIRLMVFWLKSIPLFVTHKLIFYTPREDGSSSCLACEATDRRQDYLFLAQRSALRCSLHIFSVLKGGKSLSILLLYSLSTLCLLVAAFGGNAFTD